MKSVCHVMLDTETLGTRIGSVVLSAAFVRFEDEATASVNLSVPEQQALGLEIDPATERWWQNQKPEAWAAATQNPVPLERVFNYLAMWLPWAANGREMFIWCHGASFDAPMLAEVYRRAGIYICPWSYRDIRDTRTLYDLAGIDLTHFNVLPAHIAANDALAQTRAAVAAMQKIAAARTQAEAQHHAYSQV